MALHRTLLAGVAGLAPALLAGAAGLAATLHAPATPAAGMTTHAMMADTGRQALPDSPLKTLLTQHRPSLLAGALHPDGGYGSGNAFPEDRDMAERAHWADFVDHFVAYLRDIGCRGEVRQALLQWQPGTINLNGLSDRCGSLIAFAFGDAAHGLTDQTWDSLFEPVVRERGEDPNPADFLDAGGFWGPFTPGGILRTLLGSSYDTLVQLFAATPMNAIEYAMDMCAIVDHGLWTDAPTLVFPPTADLVEVYRRNRPQQGVTALMIERGNLVARGAVQAERAGAPVEVVRVREQMPWAAASYYMGQGGVIHSGQMVAGMYQHLWSKLIDVPAAIEPPFVIGTQPRHGERGVPWRRDAAGLRIHAFFGHATNPDVAERRDVMVLTTADGTRVPGHVVAGIYQRHDTHGLRFDADADLAPHTAYTVTVNRRFRDHAGRELERRFEWSFTTAD